jgi:predicted acyltransferase
MIIFTQYYLGSSMAKSSSRLISLDIFRGLTVAFMIIVNTPGSWQYVYSPLRHAKWHGCTLTDLVFPFFLFIVGISTYYSLKKYGNEINGRSIFRIFRRMVTIFAVGLFLNIFPYFGRDYTTLRIMGVLQRIALAYGIGAIICLTVRREYLWIVTAVLLLLYWGLLAFFGGADPYSLETNFALKADVAILGKNHLYKSFGIPFDPEGLLSTIPSVGTVIIGYFIGEMIGKSSASSKTVFKLILIGAAAAGLGYLWNMLLPINKPLWTSSYVLYTAGIALAVLAIIYLIADVLKFQKWAAFFIVFGTNALFTYFLAGIWTKLLLFIQIPSGNDKISLYGWFYGKVCVPIAGNLNGSLMFAVIQMLLIWGAALILYRKKILIRL